MSDILNDDKWLNDMRDMMKPDESMLPIAVRIGKSYYKINDLSDPSIFKDTSITPSNFRVIFGSIYNMFRTTSFPINQISNYNVIKQIQSVDEKTQVSSVFFVFESDYIDNDNISTFDDMINENYDMLFDYVKTLANANRQNALRMFFEENKNL